MPSYPSTPITPGADLTVFGAYASQITAAIAAASPTAPYGFVIVNNTTPPVATVISDPNYWLRYCLWFDTVNGILKWYNTTKNQWAEVPTLVAESIDNTDYFADKIVSLAKLAAPGSSGLYILRVNSGSNAIEAVAPAAIFGAGTIPISSLNAGGYTNRVACVDSGGSSVWRTYADVMASLLAAITGISVSKLTASATNNHLLATLGGVTVWASINSIVPQNELEIKRIKHETVALVYNATKVTVDASLGVSFYLQLTGNVATLEVVNMVNGRCIEIEIAQDGAGAHTVGFDSTIKWPAGSAPTITATASKSDVITVLQINGKLRANAVQNFA